MICFTFSSNAFLSSAVMPFHLRERNVRGNE
jgi:hypothetical protein